MSKENFHFTEFTTSVHDVAGVLKCYFREMPEPLCTFEHYSCFVAAVGIPDRAARLEVLSKVLDFLPPGHQTVMKYMIAFFVMLTQHSAKNMMTSENIAIVFSPNFLRPRNGSRQIIMDDAGASKKFVQLLIDNYDYLIDPLPSPSNVSIKNKEEDQVVDSLLDSFDVDTQVVDEVDEKERINIYLASRKDKCETTKTKPSGKTEIENKVVFIIGDQGEACGDIGMRLLEKGQRVLIRQADCRDESGVGWLIGKGAECVEGLRGGMELCDVVLLFCGAKEAQDLVLGTDSIGALSSGFKTVILARPGEPTLVKYLGKEVKSSGTDNRFIEAYRHIRMGKKKGSSVLVGCDESTFAEWKDWLSLIGNKVRYVGEVGKACALSLSLHSFLPAQLFALAVISATVEKSGVDEKLFFRMLQENEYASPFTGLAKAMHHRKKAENLPDLNSIILNLQSYHTTTNALGLESVPYTALLLDNFTTTRSSSSQNSATAVRDVILKKKPRGKRRAKS